MQYNVPNSVPIMSIIPTPVSATLPQDNTGSILSSPTDGGYYSSSSITPPSPGISTPSVAPTTTYTDPVSAQTTMTPTGSVQATTTNIQPTQTTPSGTPETNPDQSTPMPVMPAQTIPMYMGCFKDTSVRALPIMTGPTTFEKCRDIARDAGSRYFGLQWPEGSKSGTAQCFYGIGYYDKYGRSTACVKKDSSGNLLGGVWANSIYSV